MTRQYWDKIHLEKYSKADWAHQPSIFVKEVTSFFPRSGKVLEIGTGQGADAEYLHSLGYEVVATDYSGAAIDSASSRINGVEFLNLDTAAGLPFEAESFEVVYSHLALHYFDLETTHKIFKDIHRVLKTAGVFATITNTLEDPEVKEFNYQNLEADFYQDPKGVQKRYFSPESLGKITEGLFTTLLLDNHGATYKDQLPNLIRFVGRKI